MPDRVFVSIALLCFTLLFCVFVGALVQSRLGNVFRIKKEVYLSLSIYLSTVYCAVNAPDQIGEEALAKKDIMRIPDFIKITNVIARSVSQVLDTLQNTGCPVRVHLRVSRVRGFVWKEITVSSSIKSLFLSVSSASVRDCLGEDAEIRSASLCSCM